MGRMKTFSLTQLLTLAYFCGVTGNKGFVTGLSQRGILRKCKSFHDERPGINGRDKNILQIPANLSSRGEALYFTLKSGSLQCNEPIQELEVRWEHGQIQFPSSEIYSTSGSRSFQDIKEAGKLPPIHFTRDGHFFHVEERYFLDPETDFCVKSISEDNLKLFYCPQQCNGKTIKGHEGQNKICLPKCCAIDEVLVLRGWDKECVKINDTQKGKDLCWKPELYKKGANRDYRKIPAKYSQPNLRYFLPSIPPNCNLHLGDEFFLFHFSTHGVPDHYQKNDIRLALDKNGNVQPLILHFWTKKWTVEKVDGFCADAFILPEGNETGSGQIQSDRFMILYCSKNPNQTDPQASSEDDNDDDNVQAQTMQRSIVSLVPSVLSIPFLLATVIIHLCLLDRLNLHGLTILSYSFAEFMSYALLTIAHFDVLLWDQEWVRWLIPDLSCYIIAVSAHFFLISSYTWVTVMNVDLWMRFSSLSLPVNRNSRSKVLKKFSLYSFVAWGMALVITSSFAIVDKVYKDIADKVPLPGFGIRNCFVLPASRGLYVYLPVVIILSFNVGLILLTMKIFFDARRQKKITLGSSSAAVNATKYSTKLFLKVFIMMGGSSIIDYMKWYYTDMPDKKPWSLVILESLNYLIPIALFVLFCLNDRILGQLKEKFPGLAGCGKPLVRMFKNAKKRESVSSLDTTAATDSINSRNVVKVRLKNMGPPDKERRGTVCSYISTSG